jgi:putative tricarboxylic transport membrane protein
MRTADLITASFLMAVGALVIFDSVRIGIGWGTDGPKSGFFPFWLALLLVVVCAGIVAQAARHAKTTAFVTREQLGPVLWVLVPATVFVLLTSGIEVDLSGMGRLHVPSVGLYVAAAVYLAFYMRKVGGHKWTTVAVLAVGIPVATFLIFEKWFLVQMPKGPLEQWLGY